MEVGHIERSGGSKVKVAVLQRITSLPAGLAGNVKGAEQTIITNSTILPEIQVRVLPW